MKTAFILTAFMAISSVSLATTNGKSSRTDLPAGQTTDTGHIQDSSRAVYDSNINKRAMDKKSRQGRLSPQIHDSSSDQNSSSATRDTDRSGHKTNSSSTTEQ